MACVLAGHRGVEWLEKGLFCSKKRCPPAGPQVTEGEEGGVGRIIIWVDPHKLSATIEAAASRPLPRRRPKASESVEVVRTDQQPQPADLLAVTD
jgi:hypothetical protein